jgi:outer membrane protein TolC
VRAQLAAVEASVRQGLSAAFLSHFEARALEQIAGSSVKELSEQLTVARARLQSGVITNADLLRVETAVANAEQQVIAARSQAQVARSSVLTALGVSPDDHHVELAEPTALLTAAEADRPVLAAALERASARRPEILGRGHARSAAQHEVSARGWSLLPDLDLEAAYLRVDGQQFAPKNSAFVGFKLQWAAWEWGASLEALRSAEARARASAAEVEGERRRVELDVASSLEQSEAARASVGAAEKAVASAQEAYRVTDVQLRAGTATTTDLLEAQAALSQARLNLTRAHYAQAQAHVALAHAVGQ